jgi:hypothetical protein
MQNLFIHNLCIPRIDIMHWKHIWHIYKKMRNSCDICSLIGSYFIHQNIYLCVKSVFNTWYSCIKCTNLWMNKFCMIFIINLLHVKFVIRSLTFYNYFKVFKISYHQMNFKKYTFSFVLNCTSKLFYLLFHLIKMIWQIYIIFYSLLKDKYPCHLKHVYRYINGLLSYGFCYIVIMWCINLN